MPYFGTRRSLLSPLVAVAAPAALPFGDHATLNNSLVSHWKFNDDLVDATGAHTLSAGGTPTYAAGVLGNALVVNQNSEATLADHADMKPATDFSFVCWVNPTDVAQQTIFEKLTAASNLGYRLIINASTQYWWGVYDGTAEKQAVATVTYGTWAMVYVQYDAATKKGGISLNASAVTLSAALASAISHSTASMVWGASLPTHNIDSMSFWLRLLTAGELTDLYNGGAGLDY